MHSVVNLLPAVANQSTTVLILLVASHVILSLSQSIPQQYAAPAPRSICIAKYATKLNAPIAALVNILITLPIVMSISFRSVVCSLFASELQNLSGWTNM